MSARNELLARIAGAQEVVTAGTHCSPDDALAMIVDRALEDHETVGKIADAVLNRSVRLVGPPAVGRRWLPEPFRGRHRRGFVRGQG